MGKYKYDFIEDKTNYKTYLKFVLSYAMKHFFLHKQDYVAVSKIYSALNLFDNSELLKVMHDSFKGSSICLDIAQTDGRKIINPVPLFKGPSFKTTLSNVIYEDIIKLCVIDVVDKYNTNLAELICNMMLQSYDDSLDLDKNFYEYYKLFRNLYFDDNFDVDVSLAALLYRAIFDEEDVFVVDDWTSYVTILNNIHKNTVVGKQDYLSKTTKQVLEKMSIVFDVKNGTTIFDKIRSFHPLRFDDATEKDAFKRTVYLINNELKEHNYAYQILGTSTTTEWSDSKIENCLKEVIASQYGEAMANMQERTGKKELLLPGLEDFPPIDQLAIELLNLLVVDLFISSIENLQKDYYRNFNFDKILHLETIKEMKKELSKYKLENANAKHRINDLMQKNNKLSKTLKDRQKDINEIIRDELKEVEKERDNLRLERDELESKLASMEEYLALINADNDSELQISYDMSELIIHKYIFIGGRAEVVYDLKKELPHSLYTDTPSETVDISNVDYVVMFPKHMSHSLFYKYIKQARFLDIPVIYCNNNNREMIFSKMYDSIERA